MNSRILFNSIVLLALFLSLAVSENSVAQVYYSGGYYVPRPHYVGARLRYLPSPYPLSYSYTYDPVYTYSYRNYYPRGFTSYRPYYYRSGVRLYAGPRGKYYFSYRR